MRTLQTIVCVHACTRLCHDFAWSVDAGRYHDFVALFAAEGAFERGGQTSTGHAAIRAFLDARPAGRLTRHLCTNIRIDMTGPDSATGTCQALMFQGPTGALGTAPAVSTPLVVDYEDRFVLTVRGWKFAHRKVSIVFQP